MHVAKILRKKGVFISTSVGANILLNDFHTIAEVKNYYASAFCKSPCGLTNIFSYNNKYGCYETLRVRKEEIMISTNMLFSFLNLISLSGIRLTSTSQA